MSAAYSLFQQFQSQGETLIEQMVQEGEQENLYLEFKQASTNQAPMEIGDRKTLAEAISGFANAEGGIIVWGIECKRGEGPEAVDQARSRKPIRNLNHWLNDLKKFTSSVVSPSDVPVEHIGIYRAEDSSSGYAVTYIPRWDGVPIMAIAKRTDQYSYFVRSGDSFVKMEAFMVADRFGRRALPKLSLSIAKSSRLHQKGYHSNDLHSTKINENHTRIEVRLGLKNERNCSGEISWA